ncbi:TPA: hypothetical protein DD425_03395 [Candidatus Saccharibacteria bacterium]|nr:hypothetical protein [Candidatus Saccharibacteria bacterium]|tara:strand:+ start:328 stop:1512 length:1185 start_codon:yes stop_codon:yes gene_type:complete
MKVHSKNSATVLLRLIVMGLFAVVGIFVAVSLMRPVAAQEVKGTLITVYDRGAETTFITQARTLREAFVNQDISVNSKDAVEPSLDEELVAPEYSVNIYRARPVLVVDGATRQLVITPYQSAYRIADDAGVVLLAEDRAYLSRSEDILSDGASLELTIDRATPVSLDFYGAISTVYTQAKTVGEFLIEKGITLDETERVSRVSNTPIVADMSLRVWREGKQTVTSEEVVAFAVEQIKDADRSVEYREVQTPGVAGLRTVTYEVDIQNGVEVARTEIASITTKEPVVQVEVIGTKPNYLPYTGGGTKTEWLAASTIPTESWGYADYMVTRESGWNPNAVNRSSGACGLAQALPCSKIAGNPYDPVTALNWMNGYVTGRYGGWEQAYAFWITNHWY